MTPHLLLFGASGGIATATRNRAESKGWNISCATRSPNKIPSGSQVCAIEADGTTESGVRDAFDAATESFGTPTAVINTLGNVFLKPVHQTTSVHFSDIMRLHVFSSYCILKEGVKRMDANSAITFLSSVAATVGLPHHELIATAKGALEGLVLSAAASQAKKGIRVNGVAPGLTETGATERLCKGPARAQSEKMHPLGRLGTPEDIASALIWLSNPEQSWVTGQILHVDGGLSRLKA